MASWKKVIVSGSAAELASLSLTTALTVPNGGTGITSVASNGILYGNGTGALQVASAAANSVLITNGSNVPSLSATLPTAVQGNITTVGTIGTGVWQGTAIADTYVANDLTIVGGTVNNTVIGGSTPAAATFTTGKFNSGIEVTGSFISIDATASFENLSVSEAIIIGGNGYISENPINDDVIFGTQANPIKVNNTTQLTSILNGGDGIYVDGSTNRVGINQSSPSYTLDVDGTASFAGITMGTGGSVSGIGSNIVFTGANSSLSGSFSGSFFGDGTGLTGVSAAFPIAPGSITSTLQYFVNNGVSNQQVNQTAIGAYMGGAGLTSTNGILAVGAGTGITVNADDIAVNYGSTSGTAVQGNTTITITGTSNEIEITGTSAQALGGGPSYQIGLPNDVTIGNDLTVSGDLGVTGNAVFNSDIIVRGTASFENTQNLEVADRFILLASGSTSDGDGGIVIQTAGDKTGVTFAWDGATSDRWGIATGFHASASAYTPEAFMAAVIDEAAGQSDSAAYQKNGNIRVTSGGDIFIYS